MKTAEKARRGQKMFPKPYEVASHLSQKKTSIEETIQSHYKLAFSHLAVFGCERSGNDERRDRLSSWMSLGPNKLVFNCCWRNATQANADAGGHGFPQRLHWISRCVNIIRDTAKPRRSRNCIIIVTLAFCHVRWATANVHRKCVYCIQLKRRCMHIAQTMAMAQWDIAAQPTTVIRRTNFNRPWSFFIHLKGFMQRRWWPMMNTTKKNDTKNSARHSRCSKWATITTIGNWKGNKMFVPTFHDNFDFRWMEISFSYFVN